MASIDIGELRGVITLQDSFSGPANDVAKGVGLMSESFGAVMGLAGIAAGAITATAGAIVTLGQRGAEVADVKGAFDQLSKAAGSSADVMLGELTKGTLGTITNFDLMKKANEVLGSGMVSSAKDMGTLAAGAQLLGDRTGKGTAAAFDILTSAIEKGRTAGLKQLGVFVDNSTAVDQYAQSVGKSVSQLSDQERAQALSAAALAALNAELVKAGPASADFGDVIDRMKVGVLNFADNLGVAIAASPVLGAGLQAVGVAIETAFGGDSQGLVKTIMGYVESFAIGLTYAADVGVEAARYLTQTYNGLKIVFDLFMTGLFVLLAGAAEGVALLVEKAAQVPVVGKAFQGIAESVRGAADQLAAMRDSFSDQTGEAIDKAVQQEAAFGRVHASIATVRDAMVAARDAEGEMAAASDAATTGLGNLGTSAALTSEQIKALEDRARMTGEAVVEMQQLIGDTNQALQDRLALSAETGLAHDLLVIEQKKAAELAAIQTLAFMAPAAYEEIAAKVETLYGDMAADAVESFAQQSNAAWTHSLTAIDRSQAAYLKAKDNYRQLELSGIATYEQLTKAHAAMDAAQENVAKISHAAQLDRFEMIAASASTILRSIFGKSKAAAIAAAVIDTAAAVVKTLAAYPWPWSLIPAAAALAAGYAQIHTIRGQNADGFAEGTPGTEFQDFGRGTATMLHGPEAVVTQAQGESLAGMVEAAIRSGQRDAAPRRADEGITIGSLSLALPNVREPEQFARELELVLRRNVRGARSLVAGLATG